MQQKLTIQLTQVERTRGWKRTKIIICLSDQPTQTDEWRWLTSSYRPNRGILNIALNASRSYLQKYNGSFLVRQ